MTTIDTPDPALAELRAEVLALRAELAQLRGELAAEVRTRRLVVVDEYGFERIIGAADELTRARLEVRSLEEDTSVYLFANEHDRQDVGLVLSAVGNVVAMLNTRPTEESEPRAASLLLDDFPERSCTITASEIERFGDDGIEL